MIEQQALAAGLTPLQVMIDAMRHYSQPGADGQPLNREKAVAMAEKAAPYVHAKLAQVDAAIRADVSTTHRYVLYGAPEAATPVAWEAQASAVADGERAALEVGTDAALGDPDAP